MARTYTRPVRFDDDLKPFFDTLPRGTVNSLINQLVHLYKDNRAVRDMVSLKDDRFADYEPAAEVSEAVEEPVETVDKPVSVLDEIVPN